MTLRVSGKNLDIGDALRSYVETRILATLSKYRAGSFMGHVTIEPEGSGFRADCTLHLNSGPTLQADAEAHEPYASFNLAADRIERRLRRHRKRLSNHHMYGNSADAESAVVAKAITTKPHPHPARQDGPPAPGPAVIAEPSSRFKEMTVSGAAQELDVTNAPFVIFRHACDGRPNLVYRRADGNIGWIDPARL
jgi:ribosomal subunit interface protein